MNVEGMGIAKLKLEISKTDLLQDHINYGDKEPIWDGHVYVYSDPSKRNECFLGRVPVQVKSRTTDNKKTYKNTEYFVFDMSLTDAKAFLEDGGVIYFVCFVNKISGDVDIFYSKLLPVDLITLIDACEGKKNKRCKFKKFPAEKEEQQNLFFEFLNDRDNQRAVKQTGILSEEQLREAGYNQIFFESICTNPLDLVGKETYLYAKNSINSIACSGLRQILSIDLNVEKLELKVGETVFFSGGHIFKDAEKQEIIFGDGAIKFPVENATIPRIIFNVFGSLNQHMQCIDFLIQLAEKQVFSIDSLKFNLINDTEQAESREKDLNDLKRNKQVLIAIKHMLDELGVSIDPILTDDTMINSLYIVSQSYLNDWPISLSGVNPTMLVRIKLTEKDYILFVAIPTDDRQYILKRLEDYKTEITVEVKKQDTNEIVAMLNMPHLLLLNEIDYCRAVNLNIEEINQKAISYLSGDFLDAKINFLLIHYWFKLVKAFDLTHKEIYIIKAKEFLDAITKSGCTDADLMDSLKINYWQLTKRQRKLSDAEQKEIMNFEKGLNVLETSSIQTKELFIAAKVLLDDKQTAINEIKKLPEDRQKIFKNYPLYYFISD